MKEETKIVYIRSFPAEVVRMARIKAANEDVSLSKYIIEVVRKAVNNGKR